MKSFNSFTHTLSLDERRYLTIPGDLEQTVNYCANQFVGIANEAITQRGFFYVALSGGSTPHAIFKKLVESPLKNAVDWTKVWLFWSDERSTPPDHPDSNYFNAMNAGLGTLPIPLAQILRMKAEEGLQLEKHSKEYEHIIHKIVPNAVFDLIMLGMGDDGHTASLFPRTHALHTEVGRLVVSNYIPEKKCWRMTFTFELINQARHICIYVLGNNKTSMVMKALCGQYEPDTLPIQRVGTTSHKALWILDKEAAADMRTYLGI